ncbi:sulfatase-like hydrolase/transferase [Arenibacter sp. F26102]|uniref:sulfatase-like hydrolase/transferase n=1 Tax=Arenibacter sp. F26102 TaxID=2926416 RepID=UPI001FF34660|nr:sulfatase-like hydrolase/transferase [Arenibacter sp. F26102]MCK0147233.1 sulfatase-like hydrolase/transferase [Arenibacter sp. F26102]
MGKGTLLILISVCLLSCSGKKESIAKAPNFVIIMADDLGYGDISCYGNQVTKTPNIDQLAREGTRFIDFHSNGAVCSPTRAALMTGKYQQRTGIEGVVTSKNHRDVGLGLNEITIAEELKKYDYNTGIYGKWHLGYAKEFNPTEQGFDDYAGFVSGGIDYHAHIDQEGNRDWWKGNKMEDESGYVTDLITQYGLKFVKENNPKETNKPFFLYLPHESPHRPYQRRIDRVLREVGKVGNLAVQDSIQVIYKEMVEVMDEGIGEIIGALKEIGEYENTVVIFISDNGANEYGSNGVLRGFKNEVYEGGSRVPAIISYPGQIKGGTINSETVLTMDLLPTVLDFIGEKPEAAQIDGISIKDNLLNASSLPERDVFFAYEDLSFVRSGKWKMVRITGENESNYELYDLSTDLSESHDIGSENPALLNEMKIKLSMWDTEVRKGVKMVTQ